MPRQNAELKPALPPPVLQQLAQGYFVGCEQFLIEAADITKRIAAAHEQGAGRPAKQ